MFFKVLRVLYCIALNILQPFTLKKNRTKIQFLISSLQSTS